MTDCDEATMEADTTAAKTRTIRKMTMTPMTLTIMRRKPASVPKRNVRSGRSENASTDVGRATTAIPTRTNTAGANALDMDMAALNRAMAMVVVVVAVTVSRASMDLIAVGVAAMVLGVRRSTEAQGIIPSPVTMNMGVEVDSRDMGAGRGTNMVAVAMRSDRLVDMGASRMVGTAVGMAVIAVAMEEVLVDMVRVLADMVEVAAVMAVVEIATVPAEVATVVGMTVRTMTTGADSSNNSKADMEVVAEAGMVGVVTGAVEAGTAVADMGIAAGMGTGTDSGLVGCLS